MILIDFFINDTKYQISRENHLIHSVLRQDISNKLFRLRLQMIVMHLNLNSNYFNCKKK